MKAPVFRTVPALSVPLLALLAACAEEAPRTEEQTPIVRYYQINEQ